MTQENKEILLKVLSEQLPYGVLILDTAEEEYGKLYQVGPSFVWYDCQKTGYEEFQTQTVWNVKPYLRPMSSMTEEERLELSMLTDDKFKFYLYTWKPEIICYEKYNYLEGLKVIDWLNKHHFDYRGLIEKGLALEAPEGMYNG